MTNIFIRVYRDGQWQSVEFDQLTDQELKDYAASQPKDSGWAWAIALAQWIRENVKEEK